MEAREPMEESLVVSTSFPTKRKAESDPAEEIEKSGDETEETGDEIEESGDETEEIGDEFETIESINAYFRSKWITPEWDVDSLHKLNFDTSEEEEGTENIDENDLQDWLRFRRQHIENKGFYVDRELWPMYKYSDYRVIEDLEMSVGLGQTYRDVFKEMACLCLQKFNQEEKEKDESFINVEFVEVMGGVINFPKTLITFKAREKPDGSLVDYQAKGVV